MNHATLAIVIPIYNEEGNLPELCRRLKETCDSIADVAWRVIFVNDGSRDGSLAEILRQRKLDSRFNLVELSRNFGHQPAISAGLAHADADAVILMDGDLQDPPEVIPDLVRAWREGGQVVLATRQTRQESGLRLLGMKVFHRGFSFISDFPMPQHAGVFGLLDRQAFEQLQSLPERNRYIPGLRSWIGFDQRTVMYDRQDRFSGQPKQTLRHLARQALDALFSFSYKPLRLMTYAGFVVSVIGFGMAMFFIIRRLSGFEIAQTGFTTLISVILFLGGVQLMGIGLLGEYLARVYDEVKQRPLYIVRNLHGIDHEPRMLKTPEFPSTRAAECCHEAQSAVMKRRVLS